MRPFETQGNTIAFTAAATAPTPVQCLTNTGIEAPHISVTNAGDEAVFIAWGPTAAEATRRAVIPSSTPQYGLFVQAGAQSVVIAAPPNSYFTGVTGQNTSPVYITPGTA